MNEYFLGVDGGQSSTTAVIGERNGTVIGWGSAGPCNHVSGAEARAKFLRTMTQCISQAAARAGLAPVESRWRFKSACLGMSGGIDDKQGLLSQLIDADYCSVTHDASIALAGATSGEPGIAVIGGTGSIAFGQNARGETARVGGWGYIFGDEGSAFDIVRQALRAILREYEGWGQRTALTPALVEAASASDPNELLHRFYTAEWPRHKVAELALLVNRIADEGDPLAVSIMNRTAQDLAHMVGSVRHQLWSDDEAVRVAWIGGVFRSVTVVERFQMLMSLQGNITASAPDHGPAVGALLLAYRAAGIQGVQILHNV